MYMHFYTAIGHNLFVIYNLTTLLYLTHCHILNTDSYLDLTYKHDPDTYHQCGCSTDQSVLKA